MSDILARAIAVREEARGSRALPPSPTRRDDASLASTAPTGAKLERKKTMRELAQEEEAVEAANMRTLANTPAELPRRRTRRRPRRGFRRPRPSRHQCGALVDEGGALRFKTDKKPVAAPPKVDHTAALLKEASSATKKRAEAAMARAR